MDAAFANWTILHFLPIFIIGSIAYDLYRRLEKRPKRSWIGLVLGALG
jgi:hypothetical protein